MFKRAIGWHKLLSHDTSIRNYRSSRLSSALLSAPDREEALSRAYVSAIAASAGYATYTPDIDRDSIDICFGAGGARRPFIHAQLKATINLRQSAGLFKFNVKKKNYDDLRAATMVPRIVIVLHLPKKEPQ